MNESIPPPKSAVRVWLRILAWIIPGVAAPALLLGWFGMVYGSPRNELPVTIGAIVLLLVIVLGCGFFNAVLRRPDRASRRMNPAKATALSVVIFVLLQVLLVPAIGFTVASGCNLVLSAQRHSPAPPPP
jgi:hypothetical protein